MNKKQLRRSKQCKKGLNMSTRQGQENKRNFSNKRNRFIMKEILLSPKKVSLMS